MPSPERCQEFEISVVQLSARVDAASKRLDEVLEEVRGIRAWAAKYGTAMFFILLLGDKAVPVVVKIFGIAI